jgi:16S rRNA (uracil1498-N3)-methyltransferase
LHLAGLLSHRMRRVRDHFAAFQQTHGRRPVSVGLWIGPEGDFSPAEVTALLDRGACPITLGPLVLRVDTAALAALALVQDECWHA